MKADRHLEMCEYDDCKFNSEGICCYGFRNDKGCFIEIEQRTVEFRKKLLNFEYEVTEEDIDWVIREVIQNDFW